MVASLDRFVSCHNIKSEWEPRGSLTISRRGWTTNVDGYQVRLKIDRKELCMPVVILAPHRRVTTVYVLAYLARRHKKKLRLFLGERAYREFKKVA